MRPEKVSIVGEMRKRVADSEFVILVNCGSLSVESTTELKKQLREAGANLHVVPNRLFRLIAREMGWSAVEADLKGPTAIIVGEDDIRTAKVVKKFVAENEKAQIKSAISLNAYLSREKVLELADLPSREVMLSMVVGTIAAPMSRLVCVMNQKLSSLLYVLKAIEQKKA